MSSCVAIGGLEAVLWEWPAFSGCPCGSGQPSAGVHGEAKRREGAGEGRGTGDVGRI